MLARLLPIVAAISFLSGCGTQSNFSLALKEPAEATKNAKSLIEDATTDTIKLKVLRASKDSDPKVKSSVICGYEMGMLGVEANLDVFATSLEVIKKVGEKPSDLSYAGYISQFRKNAKNSAAAADMSDPAGRAKDAIRQHDERVKATAECERLYSADINASVESSETEKNLGGDPIGVIQAIDGLLKKVLGLLEAGQREKVVIDTAKALVPALDEASHTLSTGIGKDFGLFVVYKPSGMAAEKEASRLEVALSLRRWMIAQTIDQEWKFLKSCTLDCLGDPKKRETLSDLANNILLYRNLAKIDTAKILTSLDQSIAKARDAADGKITSAQLLDGLIGMADALSDLNDSMDKYKKSRE